MTNAIHQDTIAAIATAPGRGGVGIIRVSGALALTVAEKVLGYAPKPRYAHYGAFNAADGTVLDEGIALFFPNPNSFTGEDVLELQGHGGPVVLDLLLKEVVALGCRLARPGEFSERAFLNDKMDLAQAEAIADLIDSASEQAARCALRSMQGEFSKRVHCLLDQLIQLRIYVEAAIDFPEEEIDFLSDGKVAAMLNDVDAELKAVLKEAGQGAILREGMNVVIAGRPNAGKSSLLNALAGQERAIVTDIAGTTRDVLKEHIHIDGMPLHIIDTAGLRDAPDEVERIGIQRAWEEITQADRVLLMIDSSKTTPEETDPQKLLHALYDERGLQEAASDLLNNGRITVIRNKADLSTEVIGLDDSGDFPVITLSAKQNAGVNVLREHLKQIMGFDAASEGGFLARRRHIDALNRAQDAIDFGRQQLEGMGAGELLAEDLRMAQNALNEITGEFSADDLLGEIFGSFCIGK
ncbi:MAG: tRNA uridine-5-carboxymethylaminomethyl(34) synthesis GTPase MnmE [Oceanospirillaceae bacterium]|uniref:tRNA uridine-5-carboxymethylaminomethyl(34) synthesis GTPase MnmE n=1 Tax=unclassified Thalassolituus TaxID=2624967 RepID=UPI000C455EBE|nr:MULTISPECIES: tRNA uridine-5-carboxymethylaminomethyl(34) synthesis GTPase MnmE [unclassified Thalassolituus]MAS25038.1 tRNA uridine-5-carboxymethylaminomethyl(34) synthesis GTPase MnmE [Oceanospirillaceae bacterium]MBL34341.1 tRNA uridine-5-carboxymethylaminomethyl(34) synthesis GTPase MnmE [Oceanospirillaceae bacterium]MBS51836.1 tRNA uridine-5-carboxymethylaminomethyl(34) synthesis GTPase MnmE [Oceanospirillaceae bacterium]